MSIHLKRAYDPPEPNDGCRVLVDRLWPRGLSREAAKIDLWLKDIAPSHELRKWFGHDPEKWDELKRRYFDELDQQSEMVRELAARAAQGQLTLIFAAKDVERNNAVALKEFIEKRLGPLIDREA